MFTHICMIWIWMGANVCLSHILDVVCVYTWHTDKIDKTHEKISRKFDYSDGWNWDWHQTLFSDPRRTMHDYYDEWTVYSCNCRWVCTRLFTIAPTKKKRMKKNRNPVPTVNVARLSLKKSKHVFTSVGLLLLICPLVFSRTFYCVWCMTNFISLFHFYFPVVSTQRQGKQINLTRNWISGS